MAVAGEDKKDSSDRIGGSGLFGVLVVDPGATLEMPASLELMTAPKILIMALWVNSSVCF